jgi:hypothetical protein
MGGFKIESTGAGGVSEPVSEFKNWATVYPAEFVPYKAGNVPFVVKSRCRADHLVSRKDVGNCNSCSYAASEIMSLTPKSGSFFSTDGAPQIFHDLHERWARRYIDPVGVLVLRSEYPFGPPEVGGFVHFAPRHASACIDEATASKLEDGVARYHTQVTKFIETNRGGLLESMQMALSILKETNESGHQVVTHGGVYVPALERFVELYVQYQLEERKSPADMFAAVASLIMGFQLHAEGGTAVAPGLQQLFGYTFDLLTAESKSEFIKIANARLKPENYLRPQAEANTNQLENFLKLTGDFENTLASIHDPEFARNGGVVCAAGSSGGASDSLKAMIAKKKSSSAASGAGGFASRCGEELPTTITELMRQVGDGKFGDLEVERFTKFPNSAEMASSTIDKSLLKPELGDGHWLHMFHNVESVRDAVLGYDQWNRVSGIIKTFDGASAIFAVRGAKTHGVGSCLLPMFFAGEHLRVHRHAIEELGKSSSPFKTKIPHGIVDPVVGVGTTVETGSTTNKLLIPLTFRSGGRRWVISVM